MCVQRTKSAGSTPYARLCFCLHLRQKVLLLLDLRLLLRYRLVELLQELLQIRLREKKHVTTTKATL